MSLFYISDETAIAAPRGGVDIAVLAAGGEIDFTAAPLLRERLLAALQGGRRHLVVDLAQVTFIDSTAIGALVGAATSLRADGGGILAVVCPADNARVLRIFDIACVATLISLYPSRAQAVRALDAARAIELSDAVAYSAHMGAR